MSGAKDMMLKEFILEVPPIRFYNINNEDDNERYIPERVTIQGSVIDAS